MDFKAIEAFIVAYEKLIDKVFNIFAVFVGGYLTYLVTVNSSRKDSRRKLMIEKRDQILIPLCSNIEDIIQYLNNSQFMLNFNRDKELSKKTYSCTQYLQANRRVYLDKHSRQLLSNFEHCLSQFQHKLKSYVDKVFWIMRTDLESVLNKYKRGSPFKHFAISFNTSAEAMVEEYILRSKSIESQFLISGVTLVHNDDEDNYRYTDFKFGDEFYSEVWGPINSGYVETGDLNLSPEQELSTSLFQHINDNFYDINIKVNNVIENNNIDVQYRNIIELLDRIQIHLIGEIDKITEF